MLLSDSFWGNRHFQGLRYGSWRLNINLSLAQQPSASLPSHGTLPNRVSFAPVSRSGLSPKLNDQFTSPLRLLLSLQQNCQQAMKFGLFSRCSKKCLINWTYDSQATGAHGVWDTDSGHQVFWNHVNWIYQEAWFLERQLGVRLRARALESYCLFLVSSNKFLNLSNLNFPIC